MLDLKGKTVFITGGAEGIGYHIGRRLAHEGMNIMLSDIDALVLDRAVKTLQKEGFKAEGVQCDVSIRADLESAAQKTIAAFGKVHMLINNAGVSVTGPQNRIRENDWRWVLDVNLMGVVYGTQVFVPLMQSHGEGGWLINVASMAGILGVAYGGPYCATKAAVVSLSEGWLTELEPSGIKVSVLCPAFVKSRIYDSMRNRQERYGGPIHFDDIVKKNPKLAILKEPVVTGIDTEIVGHRVVEALSNEDFYIFTHPEMREIMNTRFSNMKKGFNQADASPALDKPTPEA
ncbi:MAG: SDR family NAD(P)-dependent oxidoreductase [bacterium]